MKSCDKTIFDQDETIALLQERAAWLSADKTRIEVEKAAVTADYLELHDTFEKKMEKMDDTILNFYVNSMLHQGSPSYLDLKFPRTLAMVRRKF